MDDSFLGAVEERFDREQPLSEDRWKAKPFEGRWLELVPSAEPVGKYAGAAPLVRDDGAVLAIHPVMHHWDDVRDVLREMGDAHPDQIITEIARRTEARDWP